jgi:hypothetical protein
LRAELNGGRGSFAMTTVEQKLRTISVLFGEWWLDTALEIAA